MQNQKNRKVVRKGQPKKDSKSKRINFDNERVDKFIKDEAKERSEIKDIGKTRASNDVRWYANNPELLRSAATLPFSTTTGQGIESVVIGNGMQSVPGVMSLSWAPAIGSVDGDAIRSAAASIYSFVVHANSRNTSYEAPDLMLTILAGGSIFSTIAHAIRAYGTMRYFDQRNKYLPKALITAMGFNYEDLQSNLSQMWFDINEVIARSSQIWIPKNLPFVERWFWMNSNVYKDASNVKSQYYLFTPDCMPEFSEGVNKPGIAIRLHGPKYTVGVPDYPHRNWSMRAGSNVTWSQFMERLNSILNTFLDSEDRGIMMGDILKAYGADNIYALTSIDVNYMIQPQYDTEVLTQIENATIYNSVPDSFIQDGAGIIQETQGASAISGTNTQFTPETRLNAIKNQRCIPSTTILNFHTTEIPTPEQIMVATRLKVSGNLVWPSPSIDTLPASVSYPEVVGTEYLTSMIVLYYTYGTTSGTLNVQEIPQYWNANATLIAEPRLIFYLWSAFDWAPWLYSGLNVNNDLNPYPTAPELGKRPYSMGNSVYDFDSYNWTFGDWDQWTTVNKSTLRKMHRTALYSEFGVPVI